jgi:ATP-dependent Lhr-like helicase
MKEISGVAKQEKPFETELVELILNPTVKKWFFSRFQSFSLPQLHGVMPIHQRQNILVSAPTGATKTLTGFLSILNELVDNAEKGILQDKVYCVYVSPLKALNNDIRKNLVEPLQEIENLAGKELGIRVGVRTGDTTAAEKQKMLKKPPHIIITTPESLAIVLSSVKFSEHLKAVDWCIVDEIHALAENKRGVHLSLSLERLQRLSPALCRIGLSATVAPLDEVARFLVGVGRPCIIVNVQFLKQMDLQVMSPVSNLIDTDHAALHHAMYKLIDELVQQHKTTLIFTNTRAATERVVDHLKHKFPGKYADNIGAHHGSLGKELRHRLEDRLRKGELKVVVCSTSLELGIDIGFIDLVICLGSPKSVARFLQRAGRAGHKLHDKVKGRIIVMDRDDLVECAALLKSAIEKKIDKLHIPANCLDVLAQQIVGLALEQVWDERELFELIKKSYCYRDLAWTDYDGILDYLSGKFVDLEERHVFARIWRDSGKLGRRGKLGRVIYMTNIGTIPDETFITVKIGDQTIGKLDEQFLEKLKPGDVFVLGGDTYQFKFSRGMVAQVSASANRPPTVPSWVSEMLPLSFDLALEIGRFRRLMQEHFSRKQSRAETLTFIHQHLYVDTRAAEAIYDYFKEQYDYAKKLPSDKTILVEYYNDERDKKILFHTLFGRRVNDCLSRAVAFAIAKTTHKDVELGINDNGFFINGDRKISAVAALRMLKPDKLDKIMQAAIEKSEVYKRRFRHCATRALMILRNYLGHQKRVGRQQVSSMILMSALKRISNDFTILKESRRECLEDLMDIANTKKILQLVEDGTLRIEEIDTRVPSPFAFNLALQGYLDILKIEDKHEFLRRMHEQVLAKITGKQLEQVDAQRYFAKSQEAAKPFTYDSFWAEEEQHEQSARTAEQKLLREQFAEAERKAKLSAKIREEIYNLIDGDKAVSEETLAWLSGTFSKAVPRFWKDELAKFLIRKLKEIA